MSELQVIESALQRAAQRRRGARALRGVWRGVLVGAILSLLVAAAYRLWPLPDWTPLAGGLIPLPCMLVGAMLGGWRKPRLNAVARWVDGEQHLKERLSTALEVASEPKAGKWGELVLADAAGHATSLDARRLGVGNALERIGVWSALGSHLTI
jgi:hypothetical protein